MDEPRPFTVEELKALIAASRSIGAWELVVEYNNELKSLEEGVSDD